MKTKSLKKLGFKKSTITRLTDSDRSSLKIKGGYGGDCLRTTGGCTNSCVQSCLPTGYGIN